MSVVIQVENLAKQYRLGEVSTGTLVHDINRWWHRVRGREDPYLSITAANERETSSDQSYVWALQDVSFEVKQGEVLGIIGRNGAGKSTLLKMLSRITAPTRGEIRMNGTSSSLLEVGTGFHPDLTGRENIFLNGAILGMSKADIRSKLDAIVEFSGCARYLDTPVKRYSSGMVVRLGFAVAAHLEPDILIVDEVLAVGDAEFQKKCLGKMKDVAAHGRTVLFVSHNMASIRKLCDTGLWIHQGRLQKFGSCEDVVSDYLSSVSADQAWHTSVDQRVLSEHQKKPNLPVYITSVDLRSAGQAGVQTMDALTLRIKYRAAERFLNPGFMVSVQTESGVEIFRCSNMPIRGQSFAAVNQGVGEVRLRIPQLPLAGGRYVIDVAFARAGIEHLFRLNRVATLVVENTDVFGSGLEISQDWGMVVVPHDWELIEGDGQGNG